eukprot:TRINITY_DN3503_c2_g2_i1.p1 TRINITY_DN3503_c2_g2~~TRINITY_DN3503_c2_g2_i1.p1  ORF type:complete len:238 (-),score=36.54 TRINITY_DN3503_c2_g2_i1:286-999(-)
MARKDRKSPRVFMLSTFLASFVAASLMCSCTVRTSVPSVPNTAFLPVKNSGGHSTQQPASELTNRRSTLLGAMAAFGVPGIARADVADYEPSQSLEFLSSLAYAVLKPIYAAEAPLQAGSYDRSATRARIEKEVNSAPVVMYSYSLSPFCSEAKKLLEKEGVKVQVVELAAEWLPGLASQEAAAVRAELGSMTGQTSMPHVFIGGKSIGGLYTGTPGLVPLCRSGDLQDRLKAAGAI